MTRKLVLFVAALVSVGLVASLAHADIPPGPRVKPVPKVKPLPALATVMCKARPWAHIYIDGKKIGTTPQRVGLPVGTHTIRFVKGDKEIEREVTLEDGKQELELMIDFTGGKGEGAPHHTKGVRLEAVPWALLYVDGEKVGTTPKTLDLVPGEHTVVFEKGNKRIEEKILVEKDKPIILKIDMSQ